MHSTARWCSLRRWIRAGYGRRADASRDAHEFVTGTLVLAGVAGVFVGTYGVLDGTTPRALGGPMLAAGCLVAVAGDPRAGGNVFVAVSYRPDPWALANGWSCAVASLPRRSMFVASSVDPDNLYPTLQPLRWPTLGVLPALATLIGVLPAGLAPPIDHARGASVARRRRGEPNDRLRAVTMTYPEADRPRRCATCRLHIPEGELCLVVGGTGVGKSTLLGAINGLVPHFTGGTLAGG